MGCIDGSAFKDSMFQYAPVFLSAHRKLHFSRFVGNYADLAKNPMSGL